VALAAPVAALALIVLFFWLAFRLVRSLARRAPPQEKAPR
jgi:hypothetical protein